MSYLSRDGRWPLCKTFLWIWFTSTGVPKVLNEEQAHTSRVLFHVMALNPEISGSCLRARQSDSELALHWPGPQVLMATMTVPVPVVGREWPTSLHFDQPTGTCPAAACKWFSTGLQSCATASPGHFKTACVQPWCWGQDPGQDFRVQARGIQVTRKAYTGDVMAGAGGAAGPAQGVWHQPAGDVHPNSVSNTLIPSTESVLHQRWWCMRLWGQISWLYTFFANCFVLTYTYLYWLGAYRATYFFGIIKYYFFGIIMIMFISIICIIIIIFYFNIWLLFIKSYHYF
jgi:hypothetical protein